jgi:type IV pilus assembly protein PilB
MELSVEKLKRLLLEAKAITEPQFVEIAKKAEIKKIPLEKLLVKEGLISDRHLGELIAQHLNLNFVFLEDEKIDAENLSIIPEVVAKAQKAIIFKSDQKNIYFATSNPYNYEFIKFVEKKSGKKILVFYVTPFGIDQALGQYSINLDEKIVKLFEDLSINPENEENVVKIVDLVLQYAYYNRSSDIHIEPLKEEIIIRFRIDGVLHEIAKYPKILHPQIVFRLKIMSNLRTDEHAAAQDGKIEYENGNITFDVRVSILPVTEGENIVLRILAEESRRLLIEDLGLLPDDLEKVKNSIGKSFGMILTVGPTGSGKTTTLYSLLQLLNTPEVNITTIEDPVEYTIEHVRQTQVNADKELTFATGLRSIVRQDPDIIMVGEIRDQETAKIAVNSAMTGHLVLATMHANDSSTTFPRLIDMGVEPFLIASSVNLVIAQRLVRKICKKCKKVHVITSDELNLLDSEPEMKKIIQDSIPEHSKDFDLSKLKLYKGTGCKLCSNSGYVGRTGIFEIMEVDEEIYSLITKKSSADVIMKKAIECGMKIMLFDGIQKMLQGFTTLDEIIRVTKV